LPDNNLSGGKWDCSLESESNRLSKGRLSNLGWVSTARTSNNGSWEKSLNGVDTIWSIVRIISGSTFNSPDRNSSDSSLWSDWWGVVGNVELKLGRGESG